MIYQFNDILDHSECNTLIEAFEANESLHERFDNNKKPSFTQLNIAQHNIEKELQNKLVDKIIAMANKYRSDYPYLPHISGLEEFRIKKYNPVVDMFDWHVDVGDYSTARRALAIQIYLNTVKDGGRTIFKIEGEEHAINAIAGNSFCFPPMWMFPHCGEATVSEPKYILTTYMHYA